MDVFFVSTSHLEETILFRNEEDFVVAMNIIAVLKAAFGIDILAFVLMSNHVHFVLRCEESQAYDFIQRFKKMYAYYFRRKYNVQHIFRRAEVDVRVVNAEGEGREWVIAYTVMNPVAANICLEASGYRWGTGNSFFNDNPQTGEPVSCFSVRSLRRMLHSHISPLGNMRISEAGYVLPSSYINVRYVNDLFRTPKRMRYFLLNSSKAKAVLDGGRTMLPSFTDQVISAAIPDICRSLFRSSHPSALDTPDKNRLIQELNRRFCSDVLQISRVLGISKEEVVEAIDGVPAHISIECR